MPNKINPEHKYTMRNWDAMKEEFVRGEWSSLVEYKKSKNMSPRFGGKSFSGWIEARKEYQLNKVKELANRADKAEADVYVEARERQARISRFMQMKALERLKEARASEMSVDDARKMAVSGMEQERKAIGLDNEGSGGGNSYTQINFGKTNLDKLLEKADYEGVLRFIADVKRERARRIGENASTESSREDEVGEII